MKLDTDRNIAAKDIWRRFVSAWFATRGTLYNIRYTPVSCGVIFIYLGPPASHVYAIIESLLFMFDQKQERYP